jgi:hypothetical protein
MSKHRVAVLKLVSQQLVRHCRRSRVRDEPGAPPPAPAAVPRRRARRPRAALAQTVHQPRRTPDAGRTRIVQLRTELAGRGLDAGPVTIAWHLDREGRTAPSSSTIRRILHAAGLVTPEPRKRPRSSWLRFEAAAPNKLWQSDFTHWRLVDGTERSRS